METNEVIGVVVAAIFSAAISWIGGWVKAIQKQTNANDKDIEVLKTKLDNNTQKDSEQRTSIEKYFTEIKEYQSKQTEWMRKVDQDITKLFERIDSLSK